MSFYNIKTLGVRLYETCPLACSHCSITAQNGHPNTNTLTKDLIKNLLIHLYKRSKCRHFHMTGAELYIGEETFSSIGEYAASEVSFLVSVTTSLYWAFSDRKFRNGIVYLNQCCVSNIICSIDLFHWNSDRCKYLFKRCQQLREYGFSVTVRACVQNLDEMRILSGIAPKDISVNYVSVSHAGRAKNIDLQKDLRIPFKCDFGNILYLTNDSQLYGCSGLGNAHSGRKLGRLTEQGVLPDESANDVIENVVSLRKTFDRFEDCCKKCNEYFSSKI